MSISVADESLLAEGAVMPVSSFAASLVVAARHLGLTLDEESLLGEAAGAPAPTDRRIMAAARRLGLKVKARSLGWAALLRKQRLLPAVVRFRDGLSMTLLRLDRVDGAVFAIIEDPRANRDAVLVLDRARFEEVWTGDVVFVRRRLEAIDETVPFSFALICRLFFQERRMAVEVAVCTVLLSFLALSPMLFMRLVMGRVMVYHSVDTLVTVSLIMLAVIGIETGLGAVRRYVSDRLSLKVDVRLWMLVFNKMLRLPIEYFEMVPAGLTLTRVTQLRKIRESLLSKMFGSVLEVGVLVIFLPLMMLLSVPLSLITLTAFTATITWVVLTLPAYRRATGLAEKAEVEKGMFLFQNLAGMRTVKTLALDARQRHHWDSLVKKALEARLQEGRVLTLIESVITVLQRAVVALTMLGGAYIAIQGGEMVSLVTLFTFILLAQRTAAPLNQAGDLIQAYDEARRSIAYVAALTNQPEEEGRSGHGIRAPLQGHVEFVNLRFKYRGAVSPALQNVSFEVPAGMTLGIMGRSGSGKTTITRLLQRLHSDYQGQIKVDGVDVREYDVDHLRSSLGVVLQENFLFSGTIRDNITAAKSDASLEEVVQAARLAGAEEFIDKLPQGYDTYIYEGSPNLSGGQRQRLAIARALITNPRLVILDEATSALDAESEAIVNANLRRIAQGRTMLIISHRLSSLVHCDAIMVLDRGEVQDIGRHQELLERNEIYSGLWYHQNPTADESAAA